MTPSQEAKKETYDNAQRAEAAKKNIAEAEALAARGTREARDLAVMLCRHTGRLYERIGERDLAQKARAMARELSGRTGR